MARPKGSTNEQNRSIKLMIEKALDRAGGEEYFVQQSIANPVAFMTLIGKVIPSQVNMAAQVAVTQMPTAKVDGKEIKHDLG